MNTLINHLTDALRPTSYLFWLLIVSAFCFLLERMAPWRRGQSWRRPQLLQDVFFLFFNGHVFGLLLAYSCVHIATATAGWGWDLNAGAWPHLLGTQSFFGQFALALVIKDFFEYAIHYLLHRASWLWHFHRLHHSIETMDWIGNFRFHWVEILVYDTLKWLPLLLLGGRGDVLLAVGVFSTLIGHLNHTNCRIDWGPLRFVFNSSRMHLWHHDYVCHHRYGQNFGVVFSVWDFIFRTAHFPKETEGPTRLGFKGMETFPKSLLLRLRLRPPAGQARP